MGRCSMSGVLMMAALVSMTMMINLAEAQSVPSCAEQLTPCASYLNSTNPPSSCCNPLKQAVATQLTCLCNLFNAPGLLQSFNISVPQALQLSRRCGVTSDLTSCKASGSAPPPSGLTHPATPGAGGDNGGAGRVAFTGLCFLLLFWASMLYN